MNLFTNVNIITLIIIGVLVMPLLTGLFYPISSSRVQHSLLSMLNSIKFIIGLILSVQLARILFSGKQDGFLAPIYQFTPSMEEFIARYQHDIVAYIIALFVFLSVILWIFELLTIPVHKFMIIPLTDRLSSMFGTMNNGLKRILSAVWSLPKSVCMVLIFSLLLNFYANFINNPSTVDYINHSTAYQMVNKTVLHPMLSTDIAKKLPVLINDSFNKAANDFTPSNNGDGENTNYWKVPIIKYFNGVTLDEAVKSTPDIDQAAKQIAGSGKSDKEKAYLLYQWISKNIQYDNSKAEIIVKNPTHVSSGSVVTYAERKGICFDYSCLYVSMCRSVGLKVRFVTGLGYTGYAWGDHAWNQVYDSEEKEWLNVDTTFGNSGYNYFNNKDFYDNHKYEVVQYEW
ncbi:transglutaminase-like domain-containing protein [Clostridium aminobutyricum]|uniref:Transglutaminase domain-containing protein n=1 Tax=Clostridium aminobutyricum TaxID=33953 RepID=A0A939D653_CLOAM|nr:transglutaminase domain-containing protein [Clostridium aminobutyricum]MBN7771772.1 transglutaminase domain-containing protein [Clostridium aminobutyricum]